jgi:hypothetical protein
MLNRVGLKALVACIALSTGTLASAADTGWLDRDTPGGSGDWENAIGMVTKVECETIANNQTTVGKTGYICNTSGSVCTNTAALSCEDTHVKFTFDDKRGHSHTTPWLNRDNPGGTGDWELFSNFFTVACRFTDNQQAVPNDAVYKCGTPDSRTGGIGVTANNGGQPVRNLEVKFAY